MELVPIIQSVLTIVAILAAITLFISYVSFKVRQKRKPEEVYEKNKAQHMEPSFIGKSVRRITRITKEIFPLSPPVKAEKRVHKVSKPEESVKPKPARPLQVKSDPKPQIEIAKQHRIEVINNFSNQNNEPIKVPSPSNINEKSAKSLGDDIIDKYIDGDEQNLYSLKTNKKEK